MLVRCPRSFFAGLAVVGALTVAGPAGAAVPDYAWKDPAADPRWSVGENWVGGAAPAPNSTVGTLSFAPPVACEVYACATVENDVNGLSVSRLSITDPRFKLTGNALTLGAGGIQAKYSKLIWDGIIATPLTLGADQTWTLEKAPESTEFAVAAKLQVREPVTGAYALTVDFDQWSDIQFGGVSEVDSVTFNAPPNVYGSGHNRFILRNVQVLANLNASSGNPINVNHTTLLAAADLGSVHLRNGGLALSGPGLVGTFGATGLTMDAESLFSIYIAGNGVERGTDYSSLAATGPVQLAGQVRIYAGSWGTCFEPKVGDSYTLISTTGQLSGKFEGDVTPDRESIYPGYQCPDASDRALEFRYDRTSMPRTVKVVVVRRTDPPGPIEALPTTTPVPTSTTTEEPSGAPASVPANPPATTPTPLTPIANAWFFEAGKLRMTNVPLTPTSKGVCPKRAYVTITSGKSTTTKRVPLERSGEVCLIRSTLTLKGRLARALKVKVNITGSGVKTLRKTVKAV